MQTSLVHSHKHSCRSNPPHTVAPAATSRPAKTGMERVSSSQPGLATDPVCAEQSLPKPQCSPNHSIDHCRNACRRHTQNPCRIPDSHAQPTLRMHDDDDDGHDWQEQRTTTTTSRHRHTCTQPSCKSDAAEQVWSSASAGSLAALVPRATAPPTHLSTGRTCSKRGTARDAASRPGGCAHVRTRRMTGPLLFGRQLSSQ